MRLVGLFLVLGVVSPLRAQPNPDHVLSLWGTHVIPSGDIASVGVRYQNLTEDYVDAWSFSITHDHNDLIPLGIELSSMVPGTDWPRTQLLRFRHYARWRVRGRGH